MAAAAGAGRTRRATAATVSMTVRGLFTRTINPSNHLEDSPQLPHATSPTPHTAGFFTHPMPDFGNLTALLTLIIVERHLGWDIRVSGDRGIREMILSRILLAHFHNFHVFDDFLKVPTPPPPLQAGDTFTVDKAYLS
jgi:hypothetical protein